MEWNCLIVDLYSKHDPEGLQKQLDDLSLPLDYQLVSGLEEASVAMNTGAIACICIFADSLAEELQSAVKLFTEKVGCLPDSQLIIVDDPDPKFLISIYEFGVEQLSSFDGWGLDLENFCQRVSFAMGDADSTEFRNVKLAYAIRKGDQEKILELSTEIKDIASTDYRAAYARARALEAIGHFSEAIEGYEASSKMNRMFRLAQTNLGQTLMLKGKVDEAILIYEKLERSNSNDLSRKADLAAAYMEKGEWETAKRYLAEGREISSDHPRLLEAEAQLCLSTGKIGDAFKLMDRMDEVGPFFASKLNELGIKLSQSGKGKSALALYQKAHKIVRPELRYKISLNSALACRRLKAYEMALKYVQRCKKEFGSSFEKLDKIELGLKGALEKSKTAGAA